MAHIRMKLYSNCLRRYTHVTVLIPTPTENDYENPTLENDRADFRGPDFFGERPRYRVLYLLHGTHGDDTDWSYYSNIERDIIGSDLMVVCPDGGNSFWADMEDGPRQATFLTEELREYIERLFPVRESRKDRFLAGLSMGGFATLNLAAKRPDLYGKVAALSAGVFSSKEREILKSRTYPWKLILKPPYDMAGSDIDALSHIKEALGAGKKLPGIYLTVGTEDFLYESVQETKKAFDELGIPYIYVEGPGEHTFEFWSARITDIVRWMLEAEEDAPGR